MSRFLACILPEIAFASALRTLLLVLILLGGQMVATGIPPIEKATSPDKRFSVALDDDTGRIYIKDLKTNQEVGLIAEGGGASIYHVIVRWSPDGSKVAIQVGHRKWRNTFVFARRDNGFRQVEFTPPNVFAMYHANTPANHPRSLKDVINNDAIGKWLNNSEISMVTAHGVCDMDHPDEELFAIEASYVLQIRDGRTRVRDAKLGVTP